MSTTSLLWPAVEALRIKITSQAASASPEDLAYLASAIEKLAGQVTLMDLADLTKQLKDELIGKNDELALQLDVIISNIFNNANETLNSRTAQFLNDVTVIATDTKDEAIATMTASKQSSITTINTTVANANATITNSKNAAVAAVNVVTSAANQAKQELDATIEATVAQMQAARLGDPLDRAQLFFFS